MVTSRKNPNAAVAEWVTLAEAARLLGTHRQQVLKLALERSLDSDVRGRWTFISRDSINAYLAAQPVAATQ